MYHGAIFARAFTAQEGGAMCYVSDGGGSDSAEFNLNWAYDLAKSLISEAPEGVCVDWKRYWEMWGSVYNPEMHRAFQKLLLEKDVLSENPCCKFLVIVRPLGWGQPSLVAIGPLTDSSISARTVLFFTKLEYAEKWAEAWPGFQKDGKCEYYIIQSRIRVHSLAVPVSSCASL